MISAARYFFKPGRNGIGLRLLPHVVIPSRVSLRRFDIFLIDRFSCGEEGVVFVCLFVLSGATLPLLWEGTLSVEQVSHYFLITNKIEFEVLSV